MRAFVTLAALLVTVSGQAHAAEIQFDLECNGTRTTLGTSEVRPFNMIYRIDLAANVFCFGPCERTETIHEVTPLTITLQNEFGRFGRSKIVLDRAEGRMTMNSAIEILPGRVDRSRIEATCTPKPFSGFPATKF